MSLCITIVEPERVIIATDSIVYDDTGVLGWMNKVTAFPNLDLVVTNTGKDAPAGVFRDVLSSPGAGWRDFDHVVQEAPEVLREIWRQISPHVSDDGAEYSRWTHLYIAGWSPAAQQHQLCSLSSLADFEPELATNRAAVFPPPETFQPAWPTSIDAIVDLAQEIRREQMARQGGRVLIGGRLIVTELQCSSTVQTTAHEFDDSPDVWAQYVDGLHGPDGQPFSPPPDQPLRLREGVG